MTSVGKKLGLNFSRNRNAKKKSLESRDDLQLDADPLRKRSLSNLSPHLGLAGGSTHYLKPSKSSSLGSINSDPSDAPLDHDDILLLTHNVRNFHDALTKLKAIFCGESDCDGNADEVRIAAHEKLGEVLHILKGVLQKYPALHTTDVLTAAAILITKIKSCQYEDIMNDARDLLYSIDQLALAFSSSVSEYLMGDIDNFPTLGKTKSHDNLASGDLGGGDGEGRDGSYLTAEEVDDRLSHLEEGVVLALQRAKVWAKYAKDITTYVEKRSNMEAEFAKSLSKLGNGVKHAITEHSFLPFQSIYCTAVDQDIEYSATCQATCSFIQTHKFVEPLNIRRIEHEKVRKNIKDTWTRELRKMQDAVGNLRKARSMYIAKQQEYEKAKEVAAKAETDSQTATQTSGAVAKAEKKRKLEDDALHRAMEAETTYKACVVEANNRQQELEKVKNDLLAQIRELIFQSDQVMKSVTVAYFQLLQTVSAPAPVQCQALCESSQQYEPGHQYAEYVKRVSHKRTYVDNPEPYVFEPYSPDNKLYELRKASTHSSGSGSDIVPYGEESPIQSPGRGGLGASQPLRAWGHQHGDDDTDSISGSSSKSQESSPTASPYQEHRPTMKASSSYNELAETEKDGLAGVSVEQNLTFRGVTLSRAAQSHTFKKLRAPSKCRACDSYVYFQGAECVKCGLSSHKKCLENLRQECGQKEALHRRMTTFGVDFTTHVTETCSEIPIIVTKCIAEIDRIGLDIKGIYRVSGVKSRVENLCQQFETDASHVDLSEHHPNVVSNVLKLYLRQLLEPLLTFKLYPELMKLAKDDQQANSGQPVAERDTTEVVDKLKTLILQLPKANFRTCGCIMHHLKRVTDNEALNQMSASNLGIVFGPTLLRPSEGAASLNSLMDTPHQTRIVEFLILNVSYIFGADEMQSKKQEAPPVDQVVDMGPEQTVSRERAPEESLHTADVETDDTRWYVPEITENLLDELAREEPRFQQMAEEYVVLPGSTEVEPKDNKVVTTTVSAQDSRPGSAPQQPNDSPESPIRQLLPEIKSSPGLKRKLLASQVTPPGSVPDAAISPASARLPNLTQPKPYSPPGQRRAYSGPRPGVTLTKPGSPEASESSTMVQDTQQSVQKPSSCAQTTASSSTSTISMSDCMAMVPLSTSPKAVHRMISPPSSPKAERKLTESSSAPDLVLPGNSSLNPSPSSSRTSSPMTARRNMDELRTDNEPQFV